jgi:hypothetical protein
MGFPVETRGPRLIRVGRQPVCADCAPHGPAATVFSRCRLGLHHKLLAGEILRDDEHRLAGIGRFIRQSGSHLRSAAASATRT